MGGSRSSGTSRSRPRSGQEKAHLFVTENLLIDREERILPVFVDANHCAIDTLVRVRMIPFDAAHKAVHYPQSALSSLDQALV